VNALRFLMTTDGYLSSRAPTVPTVDNHTHDNVPDPEGVPSPERDASGRNPDRVELQPGLDPSSTLLHELPSRDIPVTTNGRANGLLDAPGHAHLPSQGCLGGRITENTSAVSVCHPGISPQKERVGGHPSGWWTWPRSFPCLQDRAGQGV
jgi:hypothetical protein